MLDDILKNWKKYASQQVARDDQELEESFMNQAQGFVQNKARAIFKEPYLLGFEIVRKHNDSNTRMVGMFGFKIGKQLYYIPVMFINGDIKGVESIYSVEEKIFYPLSSGWIQYLLSDSSDQSGKSVDKKISEAGGNKSINPDEVLNPANAISKKAAYMLAFDEIERNLGTFEELTKKSGVLKRFLKDAGPTSMEKLASMAEYSEYVARGLGELLSEEDWSVEYDFSKKASAKKDKVTLQLGRFNKSASANKDTLLKQGYDIIDERDPKKLNVSYVDSVIRTDSPQEPGVYSVFTADGNEKKLIVIPNTEDCHRYDLTCSSHDDPKTNLVIDPKEKEYTTTNTNIIYNPEKDFDELPENKIPSKGDFAIIFDFDSKAVKTFYVVDKSTKKDAFVLYGNEFGSKTNDSNTIQLNKNKSDKAIPDMGIYSNYFVYSFPAKDDEYGSYCSPYCTMKLADASTFDIAEYESDASKTIKQASVYFRKGIIDEFILKDKSIKSASLNEPGVTFALMCTYSISKDDAAHIVKKAKEEGKCGFFIDKKAAGISIDFNHPSVQSNYDDYMGANVEENVEEVYEADTTEESEDAKMVKKDHRFDVESATPQTLLQLSVESGNPNVFEHGTVASLSKTYDANHLVDQYIPDLQQALDKLGRLIFLIVWRPDDFAASYGSDDIGEMESLLISTYKSYGDLVLDLLKKRRSYKDE